MGILSMTNELITFFDPNGSKGHPTTDAEVAEFWAGAFTKIVEDLISPPITVGAALQAAELTFRSTLEPLVAVPNGGIAALNAAVLAWFPALAAAVVPAILTPPPTPYAPGPPGFPVLPPTSDFNAPAAAVAAGTAAWLVTGKFQIAPASPAPIVVAP